jgi:Flp pilus assembly protein TadD
MNGATGDNLAGMEAEVLAALARKPDHPALLAALGGIRLQAGAAVEAVNLLARAAQSAPNDARILADYGAALTAAGDLDQAQSVLQNALARCGADDNLSFNLARCLQLQGNADAALTALAGVDAVGDDVSKLRGDLLRSVGDVQGAIAAYTDALRLAPQNAVYLNDLGVLLETSDDPAKHRVLWQQLAADPDAHAVVFFFLANSLHAAGDLAGARAAFERALDIEPSMAEAWNNLALVLGRLGLEQEAMTALDHAVAANPELAAARSNLGSLMSRYSALDEAEAMLRQAVRLDPSSIDARTNYGALLMRQRRFAEAEAEFRRVLARQPGQPSAELNLGLLKLTEGKLEEGWPYYESRWKLPQLKEKRPPLTSPAWTDEPLDGKTLFVFAEQGFGDNIQFIRYVLELKQRFPTVRVIHYALHSLVDLLRASLAPEQCEILPWGQPIPAHDVHCALMSLPWRCGTVVANIPQRGVYIRPPHALAAEWRQRLAGLGRARVGLAWATAETFIYRSAKTVALNKLLPLFDVEGISWVNLQFGKEAAEIADNGLEGRFFDPMAAVRTFADTAAVIAEVDLVISVDTAVAHLAGAMGKPIWMLDRFDTDWRWLPPREDSPWYPTLRMFRQREFGDWQPVVEQASRALADWVALSGAQGHD